ncbi:phage tail protein [Brevundimonas sp.]|uniref:phage tail protein n=1 Tax=Brevundimonas sp. TaxID=1871086 RepID=UPI002D41803D|nr:tail fiber protein [Brevundimonas sp.]HYC75906.1 tail fiber protein [Brevundimonas sp.]
MTRFRSHAIAAVLGLAALGAHTGVRAQTLEYYVGQLQQFGTDWCPKDWAPANGQLMSITRNTPLFALLGTTYGGDGRVTFALPDLRDRAPVHQSDSLPIGGTTGQSSMTLTTAQLPAHDHAFFADPTGPVSNSPVNSMMGIFPAGLPIYGTSSETPDTPMNPGMAAPAGAGTPVPTQSPVLSTNWCIALTGVFPSRP